MFNFLGQNHVNLLLTKFKAIIIDNYTLTAPDISKQFKVVLYVDIGVCAVLFQEGKIDIYLPICYFSKKLDEH